jgi:hypothetical protein|tara:strand:+ start:447 stop:716 length:270 start_codon:yes stop_codon:yes gene_type:complete
MNNYRLTIHVENAKTTSVETGKKIKGAKGQDVNEVKKKTFNTLSFYCSSEKECMAKLNSLQLEHTIAKGKDYKKKDKYDKELYNISFVN